MKVKPPLNILSGKILRLLFDDDVSTVKKSENVQALFTFRNVIAHKWYKIRYEIWKIKHGDYVAVRELPKGYYIKNVISYWSSSIEVKIGGDYPTSVLFDKYGQVGAFLSDEKAIQYAIQRNKNLEESDHHSVKTIYLTDHLG